LHGLTVLGDEITEWLLNTCPESSAVKQWIKEELAQTKEEPVVERTRKIPPVLIMSPNFTRWKLVRRTLVDFQRKSHCCQDSFMYFSK